MTKTEAQDLLHFSILPFLSEQRFCSAETLFYIRKESESSATIGIGGRLLPDGSFNFVYVAGVRFPSLEALLSEPDTPPTKPTIFVPHHFFERGHAFYTWSFSNKVELSREIGVMQRHISQYAAPFWASLETTFQLQERLADKHFCANLPLDPIQMTCLRAAIFVEMKQNDAAIQLLEKAIAERANALPKTRREFEKLLAKIAPEAEPKAEPNTSGPDS